MAVVDTPISTNSLTKLAMLLGQFKCFIREPPWWEASLNNAVVVRAAADNGWSQGSQSLVFGLLNWVEIPSAPKYSCSSLLAQIWNPLRVPAPSWWSVRSYDSQKDVKMQSLFLQHLFGWVLHLSRQKPKECCCEWVSGNKWWPLTGRDVDVVMVMLDSKGLLWPPNNSRPEKWDFPICMMLNAFIIGSKSSAHGRYRKDIRKLNDCIYHDSEPSGRNTITNY